MLRNLFNNRLVGCFNRATRGLIRDGRSLTNLYTRSATFKRLMAYNYSNPYNPTTPRYKKVLGSLFVVTGILGVCYYLYWPKHTFPSAVAKILRKGLWAESDKGEEDFELALKYYLEALKKCDELDMDKLSDEYTGIQLKIGEMYERLNLIDQANFVYNEIATLYLKVLTDDKEPLPESLKHHFIQKDLRIIIKLVELNKQNMNLCRAILITHSTIPSLIIDSKLGKKLSALNVDDIELFKQENNKLIHFLPFLDEYINVLNLLIAINISLGDYNYSINLNLNLNKLMLLINYDSDKILLNQCNLGSLLYLQSEIFELKLVDIFKSNKIDYKKIAVNDYENYVDFDRFNGVDSSKYNSFYKNYTNCIHLSIDAYENVNNIGKSLIRNRNLEVPASEESPEHDMLVRINELIALSTYSLGVINLHLKDYNKSERLLRESRVLARNCKYSDLLNEIESELSKLFKEKKALEQSHQ